MNSDEEFIGLMSPEREAEVFKNSLVSEAKEDGMTEGIKLRTIEGIKRTAKKMLEKDFDVDTISQITGLSREEIESLK